MSKLMGVVLVFFSLGALLYKKVEANKRKLTNLYEIKKALINLRQEMSFSSPELPQLCKKIAKHAKGDIKELFANIKELIKSDSDLGFYDAWRMATEDKNLFSKEVLTVLSDFSYKFGQRSEEIEKENLIRATEALDNLETTEQEKFEKERKLIYTLGFSLVAFLVILVI